MGLEIYLEVHENPRAFFSNSSPILLEPPAHGSGDSSLPREDCIKDSNHGSFLEKLLWRLDL